MAKNDRYLSHNVNHNDQINLDSLLEPHFPLKFQVFPATHHRINEQQLSQDDTVATWTIIPGIA